MKASIRIGCAVLVLAALTSSPEVTRGKNSICTAADMPISIRQDPPPQGSPRSPENNPFYAVLTGNYVILGASFTCGIVSVNVISTAGDDYSTDFDTSNGIILLPISGNGGDYTLTIILPDETLYVGDFAI